MVDFSVKICYDITDEIHQEPYSMITVKWDNEKYILIP